MRKIIMTKLIKIGNSQYVKIPKFAAERLHLTDEIEFVVKEDHLEVRPSRKPRQGWSEAFQEMASRGDNKLIGESTPTSWDKEGWEW